MKKKVKEFSDLYGNYPTKSFIHEMQSVAVQAMAMAKQHLDDCIQSKQGVHHSSIAPANEALEFWSSINYKCLKWLKEKDESMNIFKEIEKFNLERNLAQYLSKENELSMLNEEVGEYKEADDFFHEVKEVTDIIVVAVGTLVKMGANPQIAMEETIKQIQSRKGEIAPSGKWVKDKNQDPATLYQPDYARAFE
jgi:hypothetical protein